MSNPKSNLTKILLIDLSVVIASAGVFCAAGLLPIRHLVNADYLARFCCFAIILGASAWILAWLARIFLLRKSTIRMLMIVPACLIVFLAVFLWNRRPPPNVILLILDSLRADHLGCYGYHRPTSPHLDRFAEDGLRFEWCFSQSAGTDKSLPAILSSVYPSMFYDPGNEKDHFYLPDKYRLLSEYLQELDYLTWGFSANPAISRAMNYARGYDEFVEFWRRPCRPTDLAPFFMEKVEASKGRKFLLAGLIIEPHMPYTPPAAFNLFSEDKTLDYWEVVDQVGKSGKLKRNVQRVVDLYDGEILEADAALGGFLDWLKKEGRYEESLVIITSDHGEGFLEHDEFGHGGMLYEEKIHIPLLVRFPSPLKFPALCPKGKKDALVSHVDLLPSILGFLNARIQDANIQGRNLIPYLFGKASLPEDGIFLEELTSNVSIRCLRTSTWKLIRTDIKRGPGDHKPKNYLYHMIDDPMESVNLAPLPEYKPIRKQMVRELSDRANKYKRFYEEKDARIELDKETQDKLLELGYGR